MDKMNPEFIESILESLSGSKARYFKIENSRKKIEIIRPNAEFIQVESVIPTSDSILKDVPEGEEIQEDTFDVTSPYVGFFHRGAGKDSAPIIKLREIVEEGQIIAYIYSMNVQYEVTSTEKGKIVEVLIEDGQPVEYGQPLFRLKPVTD